MEQNLETAFILSAGVGSRLAPHTDITPKPALPFLGLPLISFGYYLAQKSGINNFAFNLHHLPEKMKEEALNLPHIENYFFSDETEKLLGSGGALWKAKEYLQDKDYFLIANGDEVLIPKDQKVVEQLFQKAKADDSLCTLLVCNHPELLKTLKPVWINNDNNVVAFGMDKPESEVTPKHYTGYKVFSKRIFDYLPEGESNIFYEVLISAIAKGEKVSVYDIGDSHWHETGNFNSFVEAARKVLTEDFDYLKEIYSFYGKPEIELITNGDHLLLKPKSLEISSSLQFKGVVCLNEGMTLGENIYLKNVFCKKDVKIDSYTKLVDQFV